MPKIIAQNRFLLYFLTLILFILSTSFFAKAQDSTLVKTCQCTFSDANKYVGQMCTVIGVVDDVVKLYTSSKEMVFLNFNDTEGKLMFSIVIWEKLLLFFPDDLVGLFEGKKIAVKGEIKDYVSHKHGLIHQIHIENPNDIKVTK